MKRLFSHGLLILLAIFMFAHTAISQAQRRPGPNRVPQIERGIERRQRNAGRPQLNPAQRRQLQQQLNRRLMQEIGLTDEQRARMQEVRRNHDDQIIAAGRRLRLARRALDDALMGEQFNEALINRYTEEFIAAQAEKIRLDARVRAQMRGVLTTEQVLRLREAERRLRRQMREQLERQNELDRQKEMGPQGTSLPGPRVSPEAMEIDLLALPLGSD